MRLRETIVRAALVAGSLSATVLLLELLLRSTPVFWPPGVYGVPRYSPDLSLTVHDSAVIYNKVRWTRRAPNRDGFLDIDHEEKKPLGATRVGFFGDSHVEAVQVRLEDSFFRKFPAEIPGRRVEAFGFGISGWGTLHSLMAYRVMGDRYDLDDVVYLFYANDPGDHYYKLQRQDLPTAEMSDIGAGYIVHTPRRLPPGPAQKVRGFLDRTLLLARVVRVHLKILRLTQDRAAKNHDAASTFKVPDPNDWPSTWPPPMLEEAQLLTRRILMQFRDEVVRDGRNFFVLYVPHGNEELRGNLSSGQSWFPWLAHTCTELGIQLLDPSESLRRQELASGMANYDDHWSPAGHAAIASFLAQQLKAN